MNRLSQATAKVSARQSIVRIRVGPAGPDHPIFYGQIRKSFKVLIGC